MAQLKVDGVAVWGEVGPEHRRILTPEALLFVGHLHRRFGGIRQDLLARRVERQVLLDGGVMPELPVRSLEAQRKNGWKVAATPADLQDRRVEITGPCERKMMINALNSGARVFMADLEDALSPTWDNVVLGQANLVEAVRRTLVFDAAEGKRYELKDEIATLLVRPRGWHLDEAHVTVDGKPISASLFDFGLYFFHNAAETVARGSGPYFYLPKLENALEAALWNDVFIAAQERLGIARGTIRATVLIETILAAYEMEEILEALQEHAAGLNAGRWDYIFSIIKKLRHRADVLLPDRQLITMAVPFMRSYTERLVQVCHRRGAHAIGGMAAFVPSRRDAEVNARALAKVREDKEREAGDGFDGTWVAHPDLVPVAKEVFDRVLGARPHQKDRLREDVAVASRDLIDLRVPGGHVSREGVVNNVSVALQYLDHWLRGTGAVALYNLMEDAATAEIARAQLWQWIHHAAPLADGTTVTSDLYRSIRADELARLGGPAAGRLGEAAELLDRLVLSDDFTEFLTLPAYRVLAGAVTATP